MKEDFKKILKDLAKNSELMKEIDLEPMLIMLKNYGVITDHEEHTLRGKGPNGRYELVGTTLPKKVDEYMEYFIETLKIAEFTQSYDFMITRVNNVGGSGAGVGATGAGVAPGGVAPGGVAPVVVTTSEEFSVLDIYMKWMREDMKKNNGAQTIHAEQYTTNLLIYGIINDGDFQVVKSKVTSAEKNQELFMKIMPNAGVGGLETFITILKQSGSIVHSQFLEKELATKRGR